MPSLATYRLFISHVWRKQENSEYYRLKKLLDDAPLFLWRDYSVPEHDPLNVKTDAQLMAALDEQVRQVNCILVMAGMYVNHRRWIQAEIELAQKYNKPIIGVIPWGQEMTPVAVRNVAKEMVGWNTTSIIAAIRKYSI